MMLNSIELREVHSLEGVLLFGNLKGNYLEFF